MTVVIYLQPFAQISKSIDLWTSNGHLNLKKKKWPL